MGNVGLWCARLYCVLQAERFGCACPASPPSSLLTRPPGAAVTSVVPPAPRGHPLAYITSAGPGLLCPTRSLSRGGNQGLAAQVTCPRSRSRREPEAGHGELPLPLSPRRRMRRSPRVLQEQGSTQLHGHSRVAAQPGLVPCRGHRQVPVQGWSAG